MSRAPFERLRFIVFAGAGLLAAAPAAADEARVARVARVLGETVTAERGYRLDFPGEEPETEARGSVEPPPPDAPVGVSAFGVGLARFLLILLGVVAGGLLLAYAVRRWLGHTSAPVEGRRAPELRTDTAPEDADLDPLVEQGDYAAAIHLLLRRALRHLHGGREPPPSLTARAALRTLPLSVEARADLRVLVDAVERTRYAGEPPDAALYARCRAASAARSGGPTRPEPGGGAVQ